MPGIIKFLLLIFCVVLAVVIGYLLYVLFTYHRIADNEPLIWNKGSEEKLVPNGKPLSIMSYNIGFAAYTPEYSFFMDGGKYSRALSRESVLDTMAGICALTNQQAPDFCCMQEVDFGSTRSYSVNEAGLLREMPFAHDYDSCFAVNFNSPYLFWPLTSPHGKSRSGLLTFTRWMITDALRRQLPLQKGPGKIVDLDRCYSSVRHNTADGKELVLFNLHLSAYCTDPTLSRRQLQMLCGDMMKEREKGNYCIAGGDFNKDLLGDSGKVFPNDGNKHNGIMPFPFEDLPDSLHLMVPFDDNKPVPTCRDAHEPYKQGSTYVKTIDGFIVTDNVTAETPAVIDTGFAWSDHNPVIMRFALGNGEGEP